MGASTKIIDKWDEMAYLRDVTITSKDQEVEESRKLLKETKQRQTQLGRRFHDFFIVWWFNILNSTGNKIAPLLRILQSMAFLKAWKEKEKKENLAEIARLEQNLENLRVSLCYAKYEFDTDFNFGISL